jgi:hypothetical protein
MKGLRSAIAIMVLSALPVLTVNAAPAWYNAEVARVGTAVGGLMLVQLSDVAASPAFTLKWFIGDTTADADQQKKIYATLLAAITNDMQVRVNVDLAAGTYPAINTLYILK